MVAPSVPWMIDSSQTRCFAKYDMNYLHEFLGLLEEFDSFLRMSGNHVVATDNSLLL